MSCKLTDCPLSISLTFLHCQNLDKEVAYRLFVLGLYPKSKFKIVSRQIIYILDIKGSRITIPVDIAKQIFVE
jgi:hypothetical protein